MSSATEHNILPTALPEVHMAHDTQRESMWFCSHQTTKPVKHMTLFTVTFLPIKMWVRVLWCLLNLCCSLSTAITACGKWGALNRDSHERMVFRPSKEREGSWLRAANSLKEYFFKICPVNRDSFRWLHVNILRVLFRWPGFGNLSRNRKQISKNKIKD